MEILLIALGLGFLAKMKSGETENGGGSDEKVTPPVVHSPPKSNEQIALDLLNLAKGTVPYVLKVGADVVASVGGAVAIEGAVGMMMINLMNPLVWILAITAISKINSEIDKAHSLQQKASWKLPSPRDLCVWEEDFTKAALTRNGTKYSIEYVTDERLNRTNRIEKIKLSPGSRAVFTILEDNSDLHLNDPYRWEDFQYLIRGYALEYFRTRGVFAKRFIVNWLGLPWGAVDETVDFLNEIPMIGGVVAKPENVAYTANTLRTEHPKTVKQMKYLGFRDVIDLVRSDPKFYIIWDGVDYAKKLADALGAGGVTPNGEYFYFDPETWGLDTKIAVNITRTKDGISPNEGTYE